MVRYPQEVEVFLDGPCGPASPSIQGHSFRRKGSLHCSMQARLWVERERSAREVDEGMENNKCASASYVRLHRNNALPSSEHSKVSWASYCWNCGSRSRCYGKGVSSNHFWLHRVSCELFEGVACETTCP